MLRPKSSVSFSISQTLFTLALLLFFFTLLNGYLLNLISDYRANYWLVTLGVVVEFVALFFAARRWVRIENDPFELAGFLLVVIGVWVYFLAPSLPTLLPPTQSEDAVRVYTQVLFTYPEGTLVSWYPAGGTFFVATLSHWLGWEPLRVLHPVAALIVALCAGAVYGIACDLLPKQRASKVWALLAPALLFVPWSYFAGIINWEQYFFAQAFAQLFTLAALWFTLSYTRQPGAIFAGLVGAALLGVVAAYPIFVALPFGLFALVVIATANRATTRIAPTLGVLIALMFLAAIALQRGGILDLNAGQISTTSDVGAGGVTNPSLDTLGGPIFLFLVLAGIPLAWRAGPMGKALVAFLIVWLLQFIVLVLLQPLLKISGYRVDKTFYILVFPFAIFAAFALARVLGFLSARLETAPRALIALWVMVGLLLGVGVAVVRPPIAFSPLTSTELETAQWAKRHLDTYQINTLDASRIRAYWLAFGIWRETLPNEWFQWIPAGTKLGPETFDEWFADPSWGNWLFVRDVNTLGAAPVQIIYHSGESAIAQKPSFAVPSSMPSRVLRWHFGSALKLVGLDLPDVKLSPGDPVRLTTYTESIYPPPATVSWRLELVDRQGNAVSQVERDPFANKYPVQRWPQGRVARDEWQLPTDSKIASGAYELRLGLFRREGGDFVEAFPVIADGLGKPVLAAPIAKIGIPFPAPSDEELKASKPLGARIGDNFELSSYALQTNRAARRVRLTLYWQGVSRSQNDYTVFVHVLDASGKIIAQQDREPLNGDYPTSVWDPQEIIKDEYDFTVAGDVTTPLTIEIGMYLQPGLKRLSVGDSDHVQINLGF